MSEQSGRRILISDSTDAAVNLAIEEFLLADAVPGQNTLFLYENSPTVVIGRFQNPWKECRTGLAERRGVPVRRRISGGGTVVHAPGNLNFSLITGNRHPNKDANLDLVIRALRSFGLDVFRNSRFDLRMRLPGDAAPGGDGLKVSGSAFRQTAGSSMHHATLLVNADLESLRSLLHQPPRDMAVKGVASVPSPVANLSDSVPGLGVREVMEALCLEWGGVMESCGQDDFAGIDTFAAAVQHLRSDEWVWEKTPAFSETFTGLAGCPGESMVLEVRRGHISAAATPAGFLVGRRYHGADILEAMAEGRTPWLEELARWVDGDGHPG